MSLISVVRDVCFAVGVNPPTSVIASTVQPRTQAELLSLANEIAQRIAYDVREWTVLKATAEFVGDGVATAFDLPSSFKRMLLTANVWRSNQTRAPMRFIPDTDEWLQRRLNGDEESVGEWTIIGGQMHIFPVLAGPIAAVPPGPDTPGSNAVPAHKATFVYLDKNCIRLGDGVSTGVFYGDHFTRDDDEFRISERLLKLGMIWQWKANKGSPYAEDMGTYSDALLMVAGADSPAPIIIGDGRQRMVDAYHIQ